MALYAFDGTWNTAKDDEDPQYQNTNVVRFFKAYDKHAGTRNLYVAGVGTRFDVIGRVLGGVFGLGELPRLNEAYTHLCERWAEGDTIIDIVGFSRGAATTLDFCHIIQDRKIRKPGTDVVVDANPKVRFLGVWDVVAAFGLANLGGADLNIGHHLTLPKADLKYAFHALALDERRPSFLPTRLPGACEVWFRGVHSDIGGGNTNRGLNDITLKWMMSKARAAELPIAAEDIAALRPDPAAAPHPAAPLKLDVRLVSAVDRRHFSIAPTTDWRNPPGTCPVESAQDEQVASAIGAGGVNVLPVEFLNRVKILASVAEAQARALDFPLDGVREALMTLIEGRIPLVTNDAELLAARDSVIRLVSEIVAGAKRHGFHALNEFFLTEALFNLRPIFPFTD
jgi:hypothetical protein